MRERGGGRESAHYNHIDNINKHIENYSNHLSKDSQTNVKCECEYAYEYPNVVGVIVDRDNYGTAKRLFDIDLSLMREAGRRKRKRGWRE